MRIDVNLTKKYMDIWLAHGDPPPDIQGLQARYRDFDLVIWRSGADALAGLTAELLRNNRDIELPELAEAEPETAASVRPAGPEAKIRRARRKRSPSR